MARVTIDDCVDKIENQFDLALLASQRALQIESGSRSHVPVYGDKPTVISLREIAAGLVNQQTLEAEMQRQIEEQRQLKQRRVEDNLVGNDDVNPQIEVTNEATTG